MYVCTMTVGPPSSAKGRLQVSFTVAPELAQKAQADIGLPIPTEHRVSVCVCLIESVF